MNEELRSIPPEILGRLPAGAKQMEAPLTVDQGFKAARLKELSAFVQVLFPYALELQRAGWRVDLRPQIFGVIGTNKNGKLYSGHRVRLQYCVPDPSMFQDEAIDYRTGEIFRWPSDSCLAKPWRIKCKKNEAAPQYEDFESALKVFRALIAICPIYD